MRDETNSFSYSSFILAFAPAARVQRFVSRPFQQMSAVLSVSSLCDSFFPVIAKYGSPDTPRIFSPNYMSLLVKHNYRLCAYRTKGDLNFSCLGVELNTCLAHH